MLQPQEQTILDNFKAEVRDIEAELLRIAASEAASNPTFAAPSNAAASAAAEDDPELWRIVTAADSLRGLLVMLEDEGLSFTERCRRVAGVIRGIFRGWADSRRSFSEMMAKHDSVHTRIVRLYESGDAHYTAER